MLVHPSTLRPVIGVVVVIDISEQGVAVTFVQDDADVSVDTGRPEVWILAAINPVQRQPWTIGVLLDVERGDLGRCLLLPGEFAKRLCEAGCD